MGCDIHLHTEIKVAGKWHHWGTPKIDRNYYLFAKMANVRNDGVSRVEPLSTPKGIPDDTTDTTRLFLTYNMYHSHSWLDSKEIAELEIWAQYNRPVYLEDDVHWPESQWGYLLGDGWSNYKQSCSAIEDIRFIFWFDN